ENIVSAMAEGNVLAVIFVAVIAGLALGSMLYSDSEWMRSLAEPVKKLSDAGSEIMFKIVRGVLEYGPIGVFALIAVVVGETGDRKSTRLNSSHVSISYAVFCLTKKTRVP